MPSTNQTNENFKDELTINAGLAHELRTELSQKEILLSLNTDIASIRDKKDILTIIHPKLRQLFGTEDIFICVLDKEKETLNPFLRTCGAERHNYPGYDEKMNSNFPVHDGFIDEILKANQPLVFDIDEVLSWNKPPAFIQTAGDAGLKASLSRSLVNGTEIIGVLTLWSDKKNSFAEHHIQLIERVADQVSMVVTNILTNEAIRQQDRENEVLIEISNEVAAIRNKDDLSALLATVLKKYLAYDDGVITLYNKETNTYSVYAYHIEKKRAEHPLISAALNYHYPVTDNDLSNSHKPVVTDVEVLAQKGIKQVEFILQAGIKEFASIKLVDGDRFIGLFALLAEKKNSFTASSLYIMQRISYQISIAVAKLKAIEEINERNKENEILLSVSNALSSIREKADLLPILKWELGCLGFYNDISIAKVDENGKTFSSFLVNSQSKRRAHPVSPQMEAARHLYPDGIFEVALYAKRPVFFDLTQLIERPGIPSYIRFIYENGVVDMVGVPLKDRNREIGVLFLFSPQKKSFTESQLTVVLSIGNQLGTAVANILANEEIKNREYEKSILLSLSNEIAAVKNKEGLLAVISSKLKELFAVKGFVIALISEDKKTHSSFLADLEYEIKNHPSFREIMSQNFSFDDGVFNLVMESAGPVTFIVKDLEEKEDAAYIGFWKLLGIEKIIGVALRVGDVDLGCLFFHLANGSSTLVRTNLLKGVCAQVSIALSNILALQKIGKNLEEIKRYKEQLEEEKMYLQEEVGSGYTYTDIIGISGEMQKVFHQLSQVSFANSTVLILGETGTGKELIARAIHNGSPRKDKLMVKVNCAAMPVSLIESEMFGHEKGSFTGAIDRRIGKFELANNGTLFLDEIGEMPADVQVKLLRALQEREIERIGGKTTIKINVRIIAATNRNLQKEVDEGRFRRDLFYRLNVFPIHLPPLRDRKEDIPVLVSHFIDKYAKNAGKNIRNISGKAMKELLAYSWPGNVRELEHLVERSVLMTEGHVIKEVHLPASNNPGLKTAMEQEYLKTHEENERDHIIRVLNKCNGKIYGAGGAAEILGLRVSTLNSKIKKLGIKKNRLYT